MGDGIYSKGKLTTVISGDIRTEHTCYDALGRVTLHRQWTNSAQPYEFSYTYNAADQLTSTKYPSGRTIVNTFDDAGRLGTVAGLYNQVSTPYVGGPQDSTASNIQYSAAGAMQAAKMGPFYESRLYNERLQPVQINVGSSAGTSNKLALTFSYGTTGNNGNLLSQTVGGAAPFTYTYTYDRANRLLKAERGAIWREVNQYDDYGNRWLDTGQSVGADTNGVPLTSGWFNAPTNRMSGVGYDAAGNQTQVGGYTITYDGENRQSVAQMGGQSFRYFYDGFGRRVMRKGCPDAQCSNPTFVVWARTADGEVAAEYNPAPVHTVGTQWLFADHLGSTRAVMTSTGGSAQSIEYSPFGGELAQNPVETKVKFTGKERDAELASSALRDGLDYFGARYFGPAQGRFTSPDAPLVDQHPEDPQSWNLYAYVRNNPLRYLDPSGHNCLGALLGTDSPESCIDQLKGAAKAVANLPTGLVNAPNRLTNLAISGFTDFKFPDVVATPYEPSNRDEAEGMQAMQVTMAAVPFAEAASAGTAGTTLPTAASVGGRLGKASTRAQNAAIADSLESRGFTITGGGGRLPEEYLAGPGGGREGSTFVDVTGVRDGRTVRVQTIDTRADGITPTTREADAAARIRAQQRPRDHLVLIPKNK